MIKICDVKTEEVPIQIVQMNDEGFDGLAVLSNYGNIYQYSKRFEKWTTLPEIPFIENEQKDQE